MSSAFHGARVLETFFFLKNARRCVRALPITPLPGRGHQLTRDDKENSWPEGPRFWSRRQRQAKPPNVGGGERPARTIKKAAWAVPARTRRCQITSESIARVDLTADIARRRTGQHQQQQKKLKDIHQNCLFTLKNCLFQLAIRQEKRK